MCTSLAVLTDPAKRKTYDDTGRIEEDRPDNDRAAALQTIDLHIGNFINEYLASNFGVDKDPRSKNVIKMIQGKIKLEISQARESIVVGAAAIDFMRDMMTRFSLKTPGTCAEDDPIGRGLDRQIKNAEQQLSEIRTAIRRHQLALTILDGYSFKVNVPDPVTTATAMDLAGVYTPPPIPTLSEYLADLERIWPK